MPHFREYLLVIPAIAMLVCAGCSPSTNTTAVVDDIKTKARAAHPNDPVAAEKAANQALENKLAQTGTGNNQKEMAAFAFLGYYTKHVHAIPKACLEQGVQLKAYPDAFAEANKVPFEISSKLVDSKKAIQRTMPFSIDAAKKELDRFAEITGVKFKDACTQIEADAPRMAEGTKFSTVMPQVYAQLVAGRANP